MENFRYINCGSRKRRPSSSGDSDMKDDPMDECNAALVLMSLSCSPHSPRGGAWGGRSSASPEGSSSGSWRSGTPSPPLGGSPSSCPNSLSDEGIGLEFCDRDEVPKKKKVGSYFNFSNGKTEVEPYRQWKMSRMVFQCTFRNCAATTNARSTIEAHVRKAHLGPKSNNPEESDHEEEFYYTEREVPPPPTLSHRDMCRPPHEDPDYQRQLVGSFRQGLLIQSNAGMTNLFPAGPITIPGVIQTPWANSHSPNSPQKHMKMSGAPTSPARRSRDSKKCRKAYGMERRDMWCTQCKWKKACSRFGD